LSIGGAKQNPIHPAILRGGSGFFVPYWVPMERSEIGKPRRGSQFKKEVRNDLFFVFMPIQFRLNEVFSFEFFYSRARGGILLRLDT